MAFQSGQTLKHYRLIEKIGEGGMGVVWKAEDTTLHRQVALKVLPAAMAGDPERRARFEREARAVATLNHPNIVTLHSVEEAATDAGTVRFITMELVEGRTLGQIIPRGGLPLDRILEIAIPLADAVSRAHRAGITHRDLKPDNVMIDADGRLRVLDFGLAKLQEPERSPDDTQMATVTSDTAGGRVVGTVAYMSPEQAEGKSVDPASDVFSLGTILYEMASGARPFRGDTLMSTIGSILKDDPVSITEVRPALPRDMGRILRRCLAKEPDRRYQSALELRNELEDLRSELDGGGPAAGDGGASRWSRRLSLPALAAMVVVIAVTAVMTLRFATRDDSRARVLSRRPITAAVEWDDGPCWSPDARFIAFSRMTGGSFDIYVKPTDGGEAVVRAGGAGDQVGARWSPDGKYLAYISSQEPGSSVYLVPAYGGEPRRLIETDIGTLDVGSQRRAMGDRPWSEDGESLLVSRATTSGQLVVHRVERSTGKSEQLTFPPPGVDDLGATYSFDGRRILFQRHELGRGIAMVMPARGGDAEVLLDDGFDNQLMSWRPDNRRIVFRSSRSAPGANLGTNLFELDVVTRAIRQITYETKVVNGSSVSLDDRIAYTPFWHDTFLFVVDAETGERRQIASHALENFGARFSPDGRAIAYHSTRTGNSEIWLHPLDGRPEIQFTDDPGWDLYPEWSPNGDRLVFVSDRDGGSFKVYIANADGGGGAGLLLDRQLSWHRGGYSPVNTSLVSRWSPDGASIAFLLVGAEGSELWTAGPDGEGPRRLLEGIDGFDWYGDGRRAVITRRRGSEEELVAVDLETGREQLLLVGALTEIDVAPDGSAVAFAYGRGHLSMGLAVLELAPPDPGGLPRAIGEPRYVARSEGTWHVHNGSWSPDSRSLVYTQDTDHGDIYEIVER